MSDDAQEWRWVGEDGVEKSVSEQDLIAQLSAEALPNFTLVWKKGWLEWLPAMQVSELAWSLPPGKSDDPIKPREREDVAAPPAPPLYRYPVIKRRAANLRSDRPPGARPNPKPPRPFNRKAESTIPGTGPMDPPTIPYTEGLLGALSADTGAEPAREPSGLSLEEVDIDSLKSSDPFATAQPPAEEEEVDEVDEVEDVSAPRRDAPSPFDDLADKPRRYTSEDEIETKVVPSKPPPGFQYVGPHAPPAPERARTEEHATDPLKNFPAPRVPNFAEAARRIDTEPRQVRESGPPPALSPYGEIPAPSPKNKRALFIYGGMGFFTIVAAAVLFLSGGAKDDAKTLPSAEPSAPPPETLPSAASAATATERAAALAPSAAPSPSRPAPPSLGGLCSVVTAPTKIADWANPAVTPAFARIPGSTRVAVGLGQSDVYAIGITIDPSSLDRDQVFREYRRKKLTSVVPITSGGKLRFEVTRTDPDFGNSRVVDAQIPFFLGITKAGLARRIGNEDPTVVWPFANVGETTVPRVLEVPGAGYAVTFRSGDQTGKVEMGWLGAKGDKKTRLAEVGQEGDLSGTPALAENEQSVLITFASKGTSESAWRVSLAVAKRGEAPGPVTHFRVPDGGPGGDAISPSAARLPGGRWLLQWTEGSSGNRAVRAVVLGPDLSAISDPMDLSPHGVNAGQAQLYATGDVATALFYVQLDKKSHELWGTALECTR